MDTGRYTICIFIQQYPNLYRNKILLDHVPDDIRKNILRWLPGKEKLSAFDEKAPYYDALSFWIAVYAREEKRTAASVPERHGRVRLGHGQAESYRERFTILAKSVQCRFGLTVCGVYEFLFKLTELYEEYQREERFRLAGELRRDMIYLAHLIGGITGKTREGEIADELGRRYPRDSYWGSSKQIFLHLDIATRERDDAKVVLQVAARQYDKELKTIVARKYDRELRCFEVAGRACTIPEGEIDDMLDYFERDGPSILITALSGLTATGEEYSLKFRGRCTLLELEECLEFARILAEGFCDQGRYFTDW